MLSIIQQAHQQAARALSACRAYNLGPTGRHDRICSEAEPCRDCDLDAYACTAAFVCAFEGVMADREADMMQRVTLEEAASRRRIQSYVAEAVRNQPVGRDR